jgi:hypothetical protein
MYTLAAQSEFDTLLLRGEIDDHPMLIAHGVGPGPTPHCHMNYSKIGPRLIPITTIDAEQILCQWQSFIWRRPATLECRHRMA